jgi:glutamate-1-semialdehyde 2,1-aminomutase
MATGVGIDPARIAQLTEREETHLNSETSGSARMYERSRKSMPMGVASSYQARSPHPIFLERGSGSKVWDVDGSEYRDFHNGFGSMVQGHGHPAITRAVTERMPQGTHFAAMTEDSVIVAEELARRWGLPKWRFTNSGSESTMDAIRLARAHTGRELVVKMEGSYHGHHDTVMVSIGIDIDDDAVGPANRPNSVPYGGGIPASTVANTIPVPFNDADALDARLSELAGKVACVIMEPGMMNIGVVLPQDGYLAAVREITQKHDVVLIFDEVKTGITIAAGGAVERFGVTPDLVTLAKALGGGLPSGAIGGSEEVMASIENGLVYQVGTYNGNPLSMAAARASLEEVMTPEAYVHLEHLNDRLHDGLTAIIEKHGFPAHVIGLGAKGCIVFATDPILNYRDWAHKTNGPLNELAWLYNMNRGVFMTPGREEEWTLSVQHDDADVDRFIDVFAELATDLTS